MTSLSSTATRAADALRTVPGDATGRVADAADRLGAFVERLDEVADRAAAAAGKVTEVAERLHDRAADLLYQAGPPPGDAARRVAGRAAGGGMSATAAKELAARARARAAATARAMRAARGPGDGADPTLAGATAGGGMSWPAVVGLAAWAAAGTTVWADARRFGDPVWDDAGIDRSRVALLVTAGPFGAAWYWASVRPALAAAAIGEANRGG